MIVIGPESWKGGNPVLPITQGVHQRPLTVTRGLEMMECNPRLGAADWISRRRLIVVVGKKALALCHDLYTTGLKLHDTLK